MTHLSYRPKKFFDQSEIDYENDTGFSKIYDVLVATDPILFINRRRAEEAQLRNKTNNTINANNDRSSKK